MPCPFCNNTQARPVSFPRNVFNRKEFHYIRCRKCRLVYLSNFPDQSDYEAMYPPSYQGGGVETDIQPDPYIKLYGLRVSYGYQFDLIKQNKGPGARILDYGCGTGHFIGNAVHHGFDCDGAEFNPDYLSMLSENFSKSKFYTISQVQAGDIHKKYDVIRLSNVLEHLTAPVEVIEKLQKLLTPGGLLLVEGPVEDNFSLAETFRKIYFRIEKWLRPRRTVNAPPYHIFFSNTKNQRQFFKDCGFEELHFKTSEEAWPFPASIKEAKGMQGKLTAIVARISKWVTKISGRNWGNIFIYCGKVKG